jgi:hypothetical protein
VPDVLSGFHQTGILSVYFSKSPQYNTSEKSAELFMQQNRRTEGQADRHHETKSSFHYLANARNKNSGKYKMGSFS